MSKTFQPLKRKRNPSTVASRDEGLLEKETLGPHPYTSTLRALADRSARYSKEWDRSYEQLLRDPTRYSELCTEFEEKAKLPCTSDSIMVSFGSGSTHLHCPEGMNRYNNNPLLLFETLARHDVDLFGVEGGGKEPSTLEQWFTHNTLASGAALLLRLFISESLGGSKPKVLLAFFRYYTQRIAVHRSPSTSPSIPRQLEASVSPSDRPTKRLKSKTVFPHM